MYDSGIKLREFMCKVMIIIFFVLLPSIHGQEVPGGEAGGGGGSGFQVSEMIEWGQKSKPKKNP